MDGSSSFDSSPKRVDIGGVNVSAASLEQAVSVVEKFIATQARTYVCVTGAHGVIECQTDEKLRQIHNQAGMVTPDGMPLVWMLKALGHPGTTRVYGPDLMKAVSAVSARKGYRQFYYGGGDGVAELLKSKLTARHPGLDVVGTYTPPFRALTPEEDEEIVRQINATKPDIVWVGLSTPKQERWMAAHVGRVDTPVMIGVGAAFDFHSDLKPQAPLWMQQNGLEWLYRLVTEPRRLWRRYLWIVPSFALLAGRQLMRGRQGAGG